MTWEELEAADPFELLTMSAGFIRQFPPVAVDGTLTIGMAAHGNILTTLFALRAILASVTGDFELILVDDASPDETGKLFEMVSRVHRNTKVFRFSQNIEYSGSLNTILSHAGGDKILFVSNDIFITPSFIRQILAVAELEPQAGLVRGCSNFVDNGLPLHTIKDCGELDDFSALFDYSRQRAEGFGVSRHDDPFLTGDAFLTTRALLNRIGFIDPLFYGYFADHDLGVRARRAGFRPRLAMGAFAWHQHGSNMDYLQSAQKEKKVRDRWARVNENWARFKEKYRLPVSLPYQGMRRIPWDGLTSATGTTDGLTIHAPCDHRHFLVPTVPESIEWRRYRATELAKRARQYSNLARLTEAIKLCRAALKLDPENIDALTVLGTATVYQGRLSEGMKVFRRAVKLSPSSSKPHSNLLLCMNYSEACSQPEIYRESLRWASLHVPQTPASPDSSVRRQRSRIRIAYLSPDFRNHSVSFFFAPLLKQHDREKFEIYCLSDSLHSDAVTEKLMALCDGWRDIARLNLDEVEKVIGEIQPDILVDLAGHTGHDIRLPLFAKRLAAVQVTWLGYPNTTGLGAMDYRLSDAVTDPLDSRDGSFYSEQLYRLPGGFLCYEPPEKAPDVAALPLLENGHITFGSFNMLPKITDAVITVWSEILRRIPDARLIVKNHYLRDQATARRLLAKFQKQGINGERIDLFPSDSGLWEHLGHYGTIDIALDTFPYNGTTTTCESLFMGVPVVTLSGERHSGRVGLGILAGIGLPELVALDSEEYVRIALHLAGQASSLAKLRKSLRGKLTASQLCDAAAFTGFMETAFSEMLAEKQSKQ